MKTKFALLAAFCAVMVSVQTACGASPFSAQGNRQVMGIEVQPAAPAAPAEPAAAPSDDGTFNAPSQQPSTPRMIIRNADMTLVVTDTQSKLDEIATIASDYKGFIVSQSTSRFANDIQAQVTLRVEASQLDAALARIRKLAVEVRNENVRGDDVTAEFVDLQSQLKNLEAAEAQLQKIMESAEKTEDVMAVFNQLTQVRGQIDQIKGRMKFLSESAAMSAINLTLLPDQPSQPVEVAGWRPEGVAKNALKALISALQGLVNLGIWLVIFVAPILLLLSLPFVLVGLVVRGVVRRRRAKQAKA
ncbi:MAG: DUF4349 domain-containing protein [Anaerolineae bacterium]|nr:DUF4349 domain-containing protein [Anaerolineae bacterium]